MSTEKLSELSKPVMYVVRTLDGSVASVKSHSYTAPKGFTNEPLYSQEYVSALLAELEAKDQAHRVHAARLISERGVLRERVADLEGRENRVVALAGGNAELWETMAARLEAAEARLATPVRLPDALIPAVHASGEPFMRPEPFGFYLNRDDVIKKLRAAGLTVEGDE
ncbi:hypothetical protein ACTVJ2_03010 [Serratia nevei]|uniref:hypothetical protein n=1 Tax=Serratia nevei TaxID=2703794 RepID=UPI003FA7DA6E